jgi:hypothetical protein
VSETIQSKTKQRNKAKLRKQSNARHNKTKKSIAKLNIAKQSKARKNKTKQTKQIK